jgi:hypothetical protein
MWESHNPRNSKNPKKQDPPVTHWIKSPSPDENSVLLAAIIYARTGEMIDLSDRHIDLSTAMTDDLEAAARGTAANFGAKVPVEDIERLRALFLAAFRGQPDALNDIFTEELSVFYALWSKLDVNENYAAFVDSKVEELARRKGWFVQEAEDGRWYYKWFHGDPDEEGDYDTEAEAWEAASKDNSLLAQLTPARNTVAPAHRAEHHPPAPWGFRLVHQDGKLIAAILETEAPNQPLNDPAIFAIREDWLSLFSLPEDNPRRAALSLITKAPELSDMLQRLTETTRRINAIQHSGRHIGADDWSELHQLPNEAFALLARTGELLPKETTCG